MGNFLELELDLWHNTQALKDDAEGIKVPLVKGTDKMVRIGTEMSPITKD